MLILNARMDMMDSIVSVVILISASRLITVESQMRRSTTTSRRPPSRITSTSSSTSSPTTGAVTTTFNDNNGIPSVGLLSTEAIISLYCLIAVLVIVIVVIAIIFGLRKYKKNMKRVRFTRNMQINYVMYGEHDDSDIHSYTNPNFRFCGEDGHDYTEVQVEHMVKLKSVRAKSFRTLSCKLSQSEDKTSGTNNDTDDDTENKDCHQKGILNMRTKGKDAADGVREDSSGYLVPGSDMADDDDVFVDIHKGKDDYLEIKTTKTAVKQFKS